MKWKNCVFYKLHAFERYIYQCTYIPIQVGNIKKKPHPPQPPPPPPPPPASPQEALSVKGQGLADAGTAFMIIFQSSWHTHKKRIVF